MLKKFSYNSFTHFVVLLIFSFSCMDPVIETDAKYSDYTEFIASEYLNDPEQGFVNGGFEDGDVSLWGGFQDQYDQNIQNICKLDVRTAYYILDTVAAISPVEGDYYLRLSTESGNSGIFRYFSYEPGDTLVYSFSYMIPSADVIPSSPAFAMNVRLTGTDSDANFFDQEVISYSTTSDVSETKIYADGDWHNIEVSFSNSSLNVVGNYFRVDFAEWSNWDWNYTSPRTLLTYLDDFSVEVKKSKNEKPTDFNILHPLTGDAFNLDTITNFQTIPFSWEESVDADTVLYTNRLVCKVKCDGALISNGFESYITDQQWDPVLEQQVTRKMPQGYGTLARDWVPLQTVNNLTHQYMNYAVVDTVSRTGTHSFRMEGIEENDQPSFYTSLMYRLSQVNDNLDKDRIRPGTELTISGYAMTPSQNKISGDNHAELVIFSATDIWNVSTSQVIDDSYEGDIWHPVEVSVVVPENRGFPNTTNVYMGFRYSQFGDAVGVVYFDDVSISTSEPITFFVTDYYDVITSNTSTIMSSTYLKNLFSYIVSDLSGISFSQVEFEWGILATDLNNEVKAINSPISFTVIDSTYNDLNNNMQFGPNMIEMDDEIISNLLGAR